MKTSRHLKELLHTAGLKATSQRERILGLFYSNKKPLSAEDIKRISGKKPDLATIYRTIDSFLKSKILKKINLQTETAYYEIASDHHHHIVCTNCGRIEDFKFCLIEPVSKKVLSKSPYFNRVDQHSIELFAVCKNCAKS